MSKYLENLESKWKFSKVLWKTCWVKFQFLTFTISLFQHKGYCTAWRALLYYWIDSKWSWIYSKCTQNFGVIFLYVTWFSLLLGFELILFMTDDERVQICITLWQQVKWKRTFVALAGWKFCCQYELLKSHLWEQSLSTLHLLTPFWDPWFRFFDSVQTWSKSPKSLTSYIWFSLNYRIFGTHQIDPIYMVQPCLRDLPHSSNWHHIYGSVLFMGSLAFFKLTP